MSVSAPASTVVVFGLPSLEPLGTFIDGAVDLGSEPNLALLAGDVAARLYVSSSNTVYALDAATGSPIGQFDPVRSLETMAGDDRDRVLYIPDEDDGTGVYAYSATGDPFLRGGVNVFGAGAFQADAEGIAIYRCVIGGVDDGRGLIVVSDQLEAGTEFEVFHRETWAHLGIVRLTGVEFTDGVASTQQASARHPLGLFAAIDDDTATAAIGWDRLLAAMGLSC